MIRVVFVGPDHVRTFELFRRVTDYPHEQNDNPAVIELVCRSKTFEAWCTNGDTFEPVMLCANDTIHVAVVEFAYIDVLGPKYVQQYGANTYVVALDGSMITTLDTLMRRMYVDAEFSAVQCLLHDIAMKTHEFQLDIVTQIRTGRVFRVDTTVISPRSLCTWMNYMMSLGSSVVRISHLVKPEAAALVIRLMAQLQMCTVQGDVAIVPHFSRNALRTVTMLHSIKLYDFTPKLSLIDCVSRLSVLIDFEANLQASRYGVYYANSSVELLIECDSVIIGAPNASQLSDALRACVSRLKLSQFACYCNFCNLGVLSRHNCESRIEGYGYPLNGILSFIRKNAMQCDEGLFEHIAIVKPRNRNVTLFNGGDFFEHFEANRKDLHLAYVSGCNLVSLEPNFRIDERFNVWIQGNEYECVENVLQNYTANPVVLSSSVSGYLSLPYGIPCLSSKPPPYPALQYMFGFICDVHTLDYYVAANAVVYKPK